MWWQLEEPPCGVGLHEFRSGKRKWLEGIDRHQMRPNVGLQMTKERVSLKVPRNSTNGIFFYIDVIPFVSQVEVTDEIVLGG